MDFNRIDLLDILPGYGSVWQGGAVDAAIESIPGPLVIVAMNAGESDESWIQHPKIEAVLSVWINDAPDAILTDQTYLGVVAAAAGFLKQGMNVLIHCAAGVSRASYLDCGVHMALLKIDFDPALALIRAQRPQAQPNAGFEAHLRHLEGELKALFT